MTDRCNGVEEKGVDWISPGRAVETLHVLTACAVVGGQLFVSVAAWRRAPELTGGDAAMERFEGFYRIFALVATLLTVAFGLWLLRYTLVSRLVLVATPYGPVLGAKVIGCIALVAYLIVAPPLLSVGRERRHVGVGARRAWALVGAVLVAMMVGLGTSLRYL